MSELNEEERYTLTPLGVSVVYDSLLDALAKKYGYSKEQSDAYIKEHFGVEND
jgi:predicted class III extradiol MEMO1 family dioxygenase